MKARPATRPALTLIGIRLPRRTVLRVVALAVTGSGVLVGLTAVLIGNQEQLAGSEWWPYIAPQVTLVGERSLAVWGAALILALVAVVCGLCWVAERRVAPNRSGQWGWLVMGAGFAGLSLDEVGSIHERLGEIGELRLVASASTWAGVLAIPIGLAVAALAAFAWTRLRRHALVVVLLLVGAALFVSVPLQEELEAAHWFARYTEAQATGGEMAPRPWQMLALEEGTELAGALLFLLAGVIYLHRITLRPRRPMRRAVGAIDTAISGAELRNGARAVTAVLAVGLAAAAAAHLFAPGTPSRGDPLPWFTAVAGLLAGAAAWLLPAQQARLEPRAVLSIACLFWSVDQGAVFILTDGIWEGSPRVQMAIRALLAAGTLAVAGYVAHAQIAAGLRRRVITWGVLAAAAPLAGHPVAISTLLFAGHAVLLMSLVDHHVAAVSGPLPTPTSRVPGAAT